MIPLGLIKWYTREKESTDKFFNLEVSEDSVHGKGVVQVVDAKESGLDIYKVIVVKLHTKMLDHFCKLISVGGEAHVPSEERQYLVVREVCHPELS